MSEAGFTLQEYEKLPMKDHCRWCDTALPETILSYDHPGGWLVKGFASRQWLYKRCVKCDYEWSLSKLGVSR
jgi:hypothetical protein